MKNLTNNKEVRAADQGKIQKIFKEEKSAGTDMSPGDLKRSPDESYSKNCDLEETLVFIDDGFLSKISKLFGEGRYLKIHRKDFALFIAEKERLKPIKTYVYTSPPFQSGKPTADEIQRKEGYDRFVKSLTKEGIIVREGRCQRLKVDGKFIYSQKGVDSLLIIDLMKAKKEHQNINKIIIVASDSDFVPIINYLQSEENIKVILYTYFEKKRKSRFSTSNELIKSVHKYVNLAKKELKDAVLNLGRLKNE